MSPAKTDPTLTAAVDLAREAVSAVADTGSVGEHLGVEMVEERLATHYFTCLRRSYRGWRWAVSVARVPRSKVVTVCETDLVPGDGALLSPTWMPYSSRLAPGDLGPGDATPYLADDPLLEAGFEATGEDDIDAVALWELGLGRHRVLSPEGREVAGTRWYAGESGPRAAVAQAASEPCSTCGFFVPMAGAFRAMFGVCANQWSPSDSRVVSLDHGCGAHSEVSAEEPAPELVAPPIVDDYRLDLA
ncbi:MAG: DUF3027 domain-containing protein [Dermatophilaceae bacterium]